MSTSLRRMLIAAALFIGGGIFGPVLVDASERAIPQSEQPTRGAVFVPIQSYRAFDSRSGSRLLPPGDVVGLVDTVGVQFDAATGEKKLPDDAVAVTYNITITQTLGTGYVTVNDPNGDQRTSTINWTGANQTIANSGVAKVSDALEVLNIRLDQLSLGVHVGSTRQTPECDDLDPRCGPVASTHVIFDITGYYVPLGS